MRNEAIMPYRFSGKAGAGRAREQAPNIMRWKLGHLVTALALVAMAQIGTGCDGPSTAGDSERLILAIIQKSAFLDTIAWSYLHADPIELQEVHFAAHDTFRAVRDRIFAAYKGALIAAAVQDTTPHFSGESTFGESILASDYRGRDCIKVETNEDLARLQRLASEKRLIAVQFHMLSSHCLRLNQLPLDLVEQGSEEISDIGLTAGVSLSVDPSNVNRIKTFPEERWSYLFVFDQKRFSELTFPLDPLAPDSALFGFEAMFTWAGTHELGHQFGLSHQDSAFREYHNMNFGNDVMKAVHGLRDLIRNPQPVFCDHGPGEDYTRRTSCIANLYMNRDSI